MYINNAHFCCATHYINVAIRLSTTYLFSCLYHLSVYLSVVISIHIRLSLLIYLYIYVVDCLSLLSELAASLNSKPK